MLQKKDEQIYKILLLLFATMIWGGGFVVSSYVLKEGVSVFYLLFFRFLVSVIGLLIYLFFYPTVVTKKDIKLGLMLGFCLLGTFVFQTLGLKYSTTENVSIYTGTNVIIVPFLYWLFRGPRPTFIQIIATLLCIVGIGLVSTYHDQFSFVAYWGDFFTLIGSFCIAIYTVCVSLYIKDNSNLIIITLIQFVVVVVFTYIPAFVLDTLPAFHINIIIPIIYLSLFATLFCFMIQMFVQKTIDPTKVAIIASLESFFGVVFAVLFFHDTLTYNFIYGCIFILLSIFFILYPIRYKQEKQTG